MRKKYQKMVLIFILTLVSFRVFCQNWEEIYPDGGNFTILMPAKPEKTERIINHSQHGKLSMNMFILQPKDSADPNIAYMVNYTDYPIGTLHSDSTNLLEGFFNSSREGALANVQGTLLSETILSLSGYPGREIRINFKNGLALIRSRSYLVKNRLYTLQIITLTQKNFNTSINKFLDSFKLLTQLTSPQKTDPF